MKTAEEMTPEELQQLRKRVAKRDAAKAKRRKKREKFKKLLQQETDATFVSAAGGPGTGKRR